MKFKSNPKIFNDKIIIAKITNLANHPNADKLQIVTLDIKSKKPVHIVCGANNLKTNQIVPLVLPDGQVLDPKNNLFSISIAKIRDVESHGMICSPAELGVGGDSQNIWILPNRLKKYIGKPLSSFLDTLRLPLKLVKNKQKKIKQDTQTVKNLKDYILKACKKLNLEIDQNQIILTHPPDSKFGHFSANTAFILAKKLKQNPMELADQFKKELDNIVDKSTLVEKIQIAPPGFINFYFKKDFLLKQAEKLNYQIEFKKSLKQYNHGKTVVIDYSAPNIAKPFGIGHLRSTNIGQAIYNTYKILGWNCIGDNHLGDWGTQFGKLIVAIKKWATKDISKMSISDLEKLYVKFHTKSKEDESLITAGRQWFSKLEKGDTEARQLWQQCVDISLKEFNRVYELLDIKTDYAYGESFYLKMLPNIIQQFVDKKIATKSQGALIVEFDNLPPAILQKSDGATTYLTRDLATIKYRLDTWNPDLIIYEVGADQTLHFKQVFQAVKKIGWKTEFIHIAHGLIRWPTGKFSTRKGDTIHLSNVIDKAIKKATKIAKSSLINKTLTSTQKKDMINAVAIGAIKFNDLVQDPKRDIIFDWNKIMGLQGDSGPYLQYTYARCKSVLAKTKIKEQKNLNNLPQQINPEEQQLLDIFYQFEEKIIESAQRFSPSVICQYLLSVARAYNEFYSKHKIIDDKQEVLRIFLTQATGNVLKLGLNLLGIKTVEKM
ncbi:arginine--tRNA ligase [Patescibacteria group bacterium]|nr:arginine--tRNA ligase [Patescibacteria group bacterium]